jgi:hypothetical protein
LAAKALAASDRRIEGYHGDDFGNGRHTPRALMHRHRQLAERLLVEQAVTGLCVCGACMMDLDWEANHALVDWLDKAGDHALEAPSTPASMSAPRRPSDTATLGREACPAGPTRARV